MTLPKEPALLDDLIKQSLASPRRRAGKQIIHWGSRMNHYDILPAAMINCLQPGTYTPPHQHQNGVELIRPLHGQVIILTFNDEGVVSKIIETSLSTDYRIEQGLFHTTIPFSKHSIFWEEYYPAQLHETLEEYKQRPHWAPPEEATEAREYLLSLIQKVERKTGLSFPLGRQF